MRKDKDIQTSSGGYVKTPTTLIKDPGVTDAELRLWQILESHCRDRAGCYPSIARLSKLSGKKPRWTRKLIKDLMDKGLLTREHREGKTAVYYPIHPDTPRHSTTAVLQDPGSPLPDTLAVQDRGPRHSNAAEVDIIEVDVPEVDTQPKAGPSRTRSSKAKKSPDNGSRSKSSTAIKDPAKLRVLLDQIDVAPYRKEWEPQGVDVDETWETFQEAVIEGTAQKPRPNPYNYHDFPKAFRTWCRQRAQWAKERGGPVKNQASEADDEGWKYPEL